MLFLPTAEVFSQGGIFKPTPGVHAVQFSRSVFYSVAFPPCHWGSHFHFTVGQHFFLWYSTSCATFIEAFFFT